MQLVSLGFLHHAVEIPSGRSAEVTGVFGRNNGQGDRGQFPAHRYAGIAPQGFRNIKIMPEPVRGIDDLRPSWIWTTQIGL